MAVRDQRSTKVPKENPIAGVSAGAWKPGSPQWRRRSKT
jgi:hypothetical protein